MDRDYVFSVRGDYLTAAQQGDEDAVATLDAISDTVSGIELYFSDRSYEDPENAYSLVESARIFDLDVRAIHMADNFPALGRPDGKYEGLSRIRNTQLLPDNEGRRMPITYGSEEVEHARLDQFPGTITFHASRPERLNGKLEEDFLEQSVYNMTFINNTIFDNPLDGFATIENVAARYDPSFAFETVDDARAWKEVLESFPEAEQEMFGFTLDTAHTDKPLEMIEVLGDNIMQVHLHGKIYTGKPEDEVSDTGKHYDMHLPPQDGENDSHEYLELLDENSIESDVTFEIKPEELSPETVEETYEEFVL